MTADLVLVVLAVADVARSRAFYSAAFGWEVTVDLPVYVQFRLPGGLGVSVYQREGYAANAGQLPPELPPGAITAAELYLRVDDLDVATERLLAAGARLLSAAALRDWGDTTAYFADPDGNVLALFAEADASATGTLRAQEDATEMEEPRCTQKVPYVNDEQPGKKAWCACGRSANQPYCDGSHAGTGISPLITEIETARKVAWCGCRKSGNQPFCDGSHAQL